jgi:kynureninase
MLDVRKKSESLTGLFIAQFDAQLAQFGFELVTPRDAARRGSQVSFTHPDGYAIMQAVIARGVIGDFRAPNILRFGFAPLYLSHRDIVNAIAIIADVMHSGEWKRAEFSQKKAVT